MLKELSILKKLINEELKKENINPIKIILFGSRAKGKFSKESDWDFLIVIDKELRFHEKWKIISKLKRKLIYNGFPNDIILKSEKDFEKDKNIVNTLSYNAISEGIEI